MVFGDSGEYSVALSEKTRIFMPERAKNAGDGDGFMPPEAGIFRENAVLWQILADNFADQRAAGYDLVVLPRPDSYCAVGYGAPRSSVLVCIR